MARLIRALGRVFRLPDGTTDEDVEVFLTERWNEQQQQVDATTQASPEVQPTPEQMKSGVVNRTQPTIAAEPDDFHVDDLKAAILIESSGDPLAENEFGFKGLLQLGDVRAEELGVDDPFDPQDSVRAYKQHAEQAKAILERDGFEPTGFNTYLLWQQGFTGGREILKNTDKPIAGFKREKAMMRNKPPTKEFKALKKPTVGDWLREWQRHYENKKQEDFDVTQWTPEKASGEV